MSLILAAVLAAGLVGPVEHTIVSPAWLEQNLDNASIVLVEIGTAGTLDRPHIPGARFIPIESILSKEGWPPDELPPVDQLRQAFENAGVGDDGRIILYSANPLYATRAFFTLDYLGQGYRTAVLDGGFDRWLHEKRPVSGKRLPHLPKTFTPHPDATRVISQDGMREAIGAGAVLIDARSAYEFHGLRRGANVARRGHIPGAHCEPWQSNLAKNGAFLPPEVLENNYAKLVGSSNARVIVYCRTGMEASMPYFVLRSLGYDVALFDGSYAEWSRDKANPVAKVSSRN